MAKVTDLRPHPQNEAIYGNKDSVKDLIKSISETGKRLMEPLLVTGDGSIIGGHRRFRAVTHLGISEVPVRIFESEDEWVILSALLEHNRQRIKNNIQISNEAKLQMRIEKEMKKRCSAHGGEHQGENLPPLGKGKSRDAVGKRFGMSGRTAGKAVQAAEAVDKLKAEGREAEAKEVENALLKSIDAGLQAAIAKGAVPTPQKKRGSTTNSAATVTKLEVGNNTVPATEEKPSEAPKAATQDRPRNIIELDSDGAVELIDRVFEFLRTAGPNRLSDADKQTWKKIFDELQGYRNALGI